MKTIHNIINDFNLENGGAQKIVRLLHLEVNKNRNAKLLSITKSNFKDVENSHSFSFKTPYDLRCFFKLFYYFKNEVKNKDIIHAHLFPCSLYVSLLKKIFSYKECKYIFTEHSTSNRRKGKLWGKILNCFIYKSFHKIIAISEGVLKSLVNEHHSLENKVEIIYNGIPLLFKKPIKRNNNRIIVSVGRLHKIKNYEKTIKIMSEIDEDFQLYIAGEGQEKSRLINLAKDFKVTNKVKFLGFVDDIPKLLKQANIFIIMSEWEGFGLSALEAMNASLPCIVSNVDGLNELIDIDHKQGFLVESNEKDKIICLIKSLLNDINLCNQIGESAFIRAKDFDIKMTLEKYIKIYDE